MSQTLPTTSATHQNGVHAEPVLRPGRDVAPLLDAVRAAAPAFGLDALTAELARTVGAREVSFLIADISGGGLSRLARVTPEGSSPLPDRVPIAGTSAGTALRTQRLRLDVVPPDAGDRSPGVWFYAPVSDRGEALGVLELLLPAAPDIATLGYLVGTADLLAYILIADRRYTDLYERGMRSTELTLEAEIQRQLLPASFTCEAAEFTLAGWLLLASQAGGDTFDYSLDRDTLHLSITDAMGHGVAAALLASLAVGTLRNSRRRGAGLTQQAAAVNSSLGRHAELDQFVTGQLMRLDLGSGMLEIVNAGHLLPLLVRRGEVSELPLDADPVFGAVPDTDYRAQPFQLQPGDRLVLVTDGLFERTAVAANVAALLEQIGDFHAREAVQSITGAVLRATGGALLDDATVLMLDWRGTASLPFTRWPGAQGRSVD